MPDVKRTRKGRPGPKAQRSALIVARGKASGRDATVAPKRGPSKDAAAPKAKADTRSVMEAGDSVEAFLERASRREEAYETSTGAHHTRALFVDPDAASKAPAPTELGGALFRPLPVPRRPAWDASTTSEELEAREQKAFLDWRRSVAAAEEAERARRDAAQRGILSTAASVATPFERNVEVWRQLWRTLQPGRSPNGTTPSRCVFFVRSVERARLPKLSSPDWLVTAQAGAERLRAPSGGRALARPLRAAGPRRVLSPRGSSEDGPRRRRGRDVEIPWRQVAAPPRVPRG